MSYLLDELEVLQKSRTALPDGLRVLIIIDGMTLVGGHIVWHILCIMSSLVFPSAGRAKDATGGRAANKPSKN